MTEKRFTLVDDYLIEYDGSYFDLHKPSDIRSLVTVIGYVTDENIMLKQSATMYHNIFLELQKQMKGVRKSSDLDSKDFEDLIELSKGNVFDDEIGWIHLPVKEDFE